MGRGAEDDLPSTGSAACDRPLTECRAWLAERGETIVGSGTFTAPKGTVPIRGSIHCDFGPPGQDKRVNQDYALAWLPAKVGDRQPIGACRGAGLLDFDTRLDRGRRRGIAQGTDLGRL